MKWLRALACRLGLHRRKLTPYVEHGIIDGPPRRFAIVTYECCGRFFETRDRALCERAWAPYGGT